MAHNIFFIISYIILFLLNVSMLVSRSLMPTSSRNTPPLTYLQNLVGTQKGNQTKGIFELKKYLSNIGYMEITNDNFERPHNQVINQNMFDDKLERALRKYQKVFKLNLSGMLDSQTISHLQLPRCGVPDFFSHDIPKTNLTHFKNGSLYSFFPGPAKWGKLHLTYSFESGTRVDAKKAIERALAQWSWATKNSFTFKRARFYFWANIKISFKVYDHGDGEPFDGPGGMLAHAFPPKDGRLHYDGSEDWIDGVAPNRCDLFTVGLHELGHVLGLGHSGDKSAAMYPTHQCGIRKGLSPDDVMGINVLYNLNHNVS